MSEIIRQLSNKSWSEYKEKVQCLVPNKDDAEVFVRSLGKNKGWRERVSAAKIIVAYNLVEYISGLIETFERAPEYYTCCAFTTMIKKVCGKRSIKYLHRMINSCSDDRRGEAMKGVIREALNKYEV